MIEIIPKEKPSAPLWMNTVFAGSFFVLLVVLGAGALFSSLKAQKNEELETLGEDLQMLTNPEEKALEDQVLGAKQKLDDFSSLVGERRQILGAFQVLEETVHPSVTFTDASVDASTGTVEVSGISLGFLALHQQMIILRNHKQIQGVELRSLNLDEERTVNFDISLTLSADVFSFKIPE